MYRRLEMQLFCDMENDEMMNAGNYYSLSVFLKENWEQATIGISGFFTIPNK